MWQRVSKSFQFNKLEQICGKIQIKGGLPAKSTVPMSSYKSPISLTKGTLRRKQRCNAHLRALSWKEIWMWSRTHEIKRKEIDCKPTNNLREFHCQRNNL